MFRSLQAGVVSAETFDNARAALSSALADAVRECLAGRQSMPDDGAPACG
jgi:hypothetical protein